MSESFCYSTNEEYFNGHCASREEAVRECVAENDLDVGATVFTAQSVPFAPEEHVDAWQIIEHLGEAADEHAGEAAEGWLQSVTPKQRDDLEHRVGIVITEWLGAHNLHPTFWGVGDVEKHVVTAADIPTPRAPRAVQESQP